MLAYIEAPLRATNKVNGHDVLIIALAISEGDGPIVIYVDQEGDMGRGTLYDFNVNWRFNDRTRKWLDVDTGDELGSDDDDGDEVAANDHDA